MSIITRDLEMTNPNYTIDKMMTHFSVDMLPDVYNAPVPYKGYVFMVRPNMYMIENNGAIRGAFDKIHDIYPLVQDDVGKMIAKSLSDQALTWLVPYVTQRVKNFPITSEAVRSVDKQGTFYGHTVKYPRFGEDHRKGGSISLDFVNDKHLTIFKMATLWTKYIQYVTRAKTLQPKWESVFARELDMVGALFFIVTKSDGHEIVYWEKKIGVFPTENGSDILSLQNKDIIFADSISINFEYSVTTRPFDVNVLMDINALTEGHRSYGLQEYGNIRNRQFKHAFGPYITQAKGKYYLNWVG